MSMVKCVDNKCPRFKDCDRTKGVPKDIHTGEKCSIMILTRNNEEKQIQH